MSTQLRHLVLLLCSGCAAVPRVSAPVLVPPEHPRAAYYNSFLDTPHLGEIETLLLGALQRGRSRLGQASLRVDPALCHVAREYTRGVLGSRQRPPGGYVDFLLHHAGVTEPHPMIFHASFGASAIAGFPERFRHQLPRLLKSPFTDVGLAALRHGERLGITVVLLQRAARLGAVPQRVARGSVVPIVGRLEPGFRHPMMLLTTPSGRVREREVHISGRRFQSQVPLDEGPGRYTVEILATGRLGPTVVSLFPIYASISPPTRYREQAPVVRTPADERTAEQLLVRLVNRERRSRGLPLLKENPRLTRVARAHSRDMVQTGFVGHRSPRTGTLAHRLRQAGLPAAVSLENIARNETLAGAHRGLMRSPGHRRNILDPRVREVGIGVVYTRDRSGRQLYVTQNYILPIAIVDPLSARSRVWSGAQTRRRRARLPPLEHDGILEEVAAATASRLLALGHLNAPLGREMIAAALRSRGYRYRVLTASFFVLREPRDALKSSIWTRRGRWKAGVGVAQKPRSAFGDYALLMVALLAEKETP